MWVWVLVRGAKRCSLSLKLDRSPFVPAHQVLVLQADLKTVVIVPILPVKQSCLTDWRYPCVVPGGST